LTGESFDEAQMLQNIEACEWLIGALRNFEASNIDPTDAKMRAVCSLAYLLIWESCK
jgi:hypothetical protein